MRFLNSMICFAKVFASGDFIEMSCVESIRNLLISQIEQKQIHIIACYGTFSDFIDEKGN